MVESEISTGQRDWQVESFRATTFHNDFSGNAQDVAELWERVAREKLEQVSSRPREGLILAEGPYDGNRLVFSGRPERIDWNLRPTPPSPNVPAEVFVTMGPFLDLLQSLLKVGENWLIESPEITRLAFGSVLVMATVDLPAAHRELDTLLPKVELDPTGSSDFFYQINRPRQSTSNDPVGINRLSKWSVMQGGSLGLAVHGNAEPQFTLGRGYFACRLELDINTAGGLPSPIVGEEAIRLFKELVQLGKEITEKGDIP